MKKKEKIARMRKLKSKTKRIGIASMIFNVGIIIGLLYTMFTTGNFMMMLPFIVLSGLVNIVVYTKVMDSAREVEILSGKREKSGETMMDDLKKEMKLNMEMITNKGFWKLIFEDIVDAIREFRNR